MSGLESNSLRRCMARESHFPPSGSDWTVPVDLDTANLHSVRFRPELLGPQLMACASLSLLRPVDGKFSASTTAPWQLLLRKYVQMLPLAAWLSTAGRNLATTTFWWRQPALQVHLRRPRSGRVCSPGEC